MRHTIRCYNYLAHVYGYYTRLIKTFTVRGPPGLPTSPSCLGSSTCSRCSCSSRQFSETFYHNPFSYFSHRAEHPEYPYLAIVRAKSPVDEDKEGDFAHENLTHVEPVSGDSSYLSQNSGTCHLSETDSDKILLTGYSPFSW